jgi:hypothetical protein
MGRIRSIPPGSPIEHLSSCVAGEADPSGWIMTQTRTVRVTTSVGCNAMHVPFGSGSIPMSFRRDGPSLRSEPALSEA